MKFYFIVIVIASVLFNKGVFGKTCWPKNIDENAFFSELNYKMSWKFYIKLIVSFYAFSDYFRELF